MEAHVRAAGGRAAQARGRGRESGGHTRGRYHGEWTAEGNGSKTDRGQGRGSRGCVKCGQAERWGLAGDGVLHKSQSQPGACGQKSAGGVRDSIQAWHASLGPVNDGPRGGIEDAVAVRSAKAMRGLCRVGKGTDRGFGQGPPAVQNGGMASQAVGSAASLQQ